MDETRVAIIVDPECDLVSMRMIASENPTWIVSSSKSEEMARVLREEGLREITTFTVNDVDDRTENALGIVPAIELHHGEFSEIKYASLRIVAISRSDALDAKLIEFGFENARDVGSDVVVDRSGPS